MFKWYILETLVRVNLFQNLSAVTAKQEDVITIFSSDRHMSSDRTAQLFASSDY